MGLGFSIAWQAISCEIVGDSEMESQEVVHNMATVSPEYYNINISEAEQQGYDGQGVQSESERLLNLLRQLSPEDFDKIGEDLMVISMSTSGDSGVLNREELLTGPFRTKIERWERLGLENHISDLIKMVERTREIASTVSPTEAPELVRKQICGFLCIAI